ncbi:MAG: copper chaperone PCu(A)C [Rhodospirillales bacterium]
MGKPIGALAAVLALLAAAPAAAAEQRLGGLVVTQAWAAPASAAKRTGSIYLTIRNAGAEPDWLIAAHSPAAVMTELRSHRAGPVVGPARKVLGVALPAGKTVTLKPGGELIHLIDITQPYRLGGAVPVTLIFQKAGELSIAAPVQAEAPKP